MQRTKTKRREGAKKNETCLICDKIFDKVDGDSFTTGSTEQRAIVNAWNA